MRTGRTLLAGLLLWTAVPAGAVEVLDNDRFALDINGRGQMIGVGQAVPDPYRDNARIFLFLKQARLGVKARYEDVKFEFQTAFGGENANGSNTDLGLLDFVADVPLPPLGENAVLKVGQFRVPYSREGLTDRGFMNWGERSIMTLGFYQGRDYGLALMKTAGKLTGTIGLFSAGGRDVPQRYLPERLGVPEVVLRAGYNDGVDADIYHVVGTDIDLKDTAKAVYVNAIYMQDTLIGHSTVLNVRTIDKNLLIDGNYNPYIGAGPNNTAGSATTFHRGHIWFVGGDAVIRHPLGPTRSIEGEVEANWGGYDNRYGALHIAAARAQANYRFQPWAAGLRYGILMMDKDARYRAGGALHSPAMGSATHEIAPSLVWHVKRHNLKIVADAPVYLNMPLFIERGVGAYVFNTQPGQITLLSNAAHNTVRRTVYEARMMFQFAF